MTAGAESSHEELCPHVIGLTPVTPSAPGCEECLRIGSGWVHLRICLHCGKVGCCDNSPNRHATRHAHEASHPVMQSFERGEDWIWCVVDEVYL